MTCRWCGHETILTEDVSSLLSLAPQMTPEARQQAQLSAAMKAAATPCRKCTAYQNALTGGLRPDGSGWFMFDNPDGSVYLELVGPAIEGKRRVVRWTLAGHSNGYGVWTATIHAAPGGKREAGEPLGVESRHLLRGDAFQDEREAEVLAAVPDRAYAQWRSGEPTCEYPGCTNRVAHAETIGTSRRHWCEPHTPRRHYEWCPDPCARLISEARERGSRWPNR
jgi:hypothetical protein